MRFVAASRQPCTVLRDVYGWFERVERGTYHLTPVGLAATRAAHAE
jgi:hypothetical protein